MACRKFNKVVVGGKDEQLEPIIRAFTDSLLKDKNAIAIVCIGTASSEGVEYVQEKLVGYRADFLYEKVKLILGENHSKTYGFNLVNTLTRLNQIRLLDYDRR
jgi:hypothetical protein